MRVTMFDNKVTMRDAKKMERDGFTVMHIDWFSEQRGYTIIHGIDLQSEHPDCTHVLINPNKSWSDTNAIAALILDEESA